MSVARRVIKAIARNISRLKVILSSPYTGTLLMSRVTGLDRDMVHRASIYSDYVTNHANRGQNRFLFCGLHYRGLSHMLSPQAISIAKELPSFSHIVTRTFGKHMDVATVTEFDAMTGFSSFCQMKYPDSQAARLIFVRGLPSREWISLLGSQYRIDIEYFRQHLNFLEDKDYYDLPPAPSNSQNILRLRIPSIFTRQTAISISDLQQMRSSETKALWKYQRSLDTVGESMVRHYSVHDERTFTIEQDILVHLINKRGRGWTGRLLLFTALGYANTLLAIILLDMGRDLPDDETAPWQASRNTRGDCRYDCIHTVKHIPAKQLTNIRDITEPEELFSRDHAPPSICHLPRQYGSLLQENLAITDPFYGLSELFGFFVSNETQYLNLIERQANETLRCFKGMEIFALEDLNYSRRLLRRHLQHIEDVQIFLKHGFESIYPRSADQAVEVKQVQELLIEDVAQLARHAKRLLEEIFEEMSFISKGVILEESRNAINRADNSHRLTLLAFFFLPLSFTTSLFGTNFKELGTGVLSMWLLFVVLIPVTVFCAILCFWDPIVRYDWRKLLSSLLPRRNLRPE